jgi:hypothetical protein
MNLREWPDLIESVFNPDYGTFDTTVRIRRFFLIGASAHRRHSR